MFLDVVILSVWTILHAEFNKTLPSQKCCVFQKWLKVNNIIVFWQAELDMFVDFMLRSIFPNYLADQKMFCPLKLFLSDPKIIILLLLPLSHIWVLFPGTLCKKYYDLGKKDALANTRRPFINHVWLESVFHAITYFRTRE